MSEAKIPEKAPSWIKDHLRRYLETDGADGHLWDSSSVGGPGVLPCLLLTTTGRRSGESLLLPLIYGEADGGYVVVASKGGAPQHPAWYLNLEANPDVGLQVAANKFSAKAQTVSGAQRKKLWDLMAKIYPPYNDYQKKTEREIPVVLLTPQKG
jgi:deazaflavin-dependent oxidoreductase (nitroreductase family)